jgi:hypothetical protein
MENVGIFYGQFVYFTGIWYVLCMVIWCILWLHNWYIYSHFGTLYKEKSGNPGSSPYFEFGLKKIHASRYWRRKGVFFTFQVFFSPPLLLKVSPFEDAG